MKTAKQWTDEPPLVFLMPYSGEVSVLDIVRAIQRDALEAMRDRIADGIHRWWGEAVRVSAGKATHPHHLEARVRNIDIDDMLKEAQ